MNKVIPISKDLENKTLKVSSINLDDEKIIKKFNDIGLVIGQEIEIINHSSFNKKIIFIKINDVEYALRLSDVEKIMVQIIKRNANV